MLTNADIQKLKDVLEKTFITKFVTKDEFNELLFEVRKFNDELLVTGYRQSKHTDMLESHDDRLRALEEKMGLRKSN